MQISKSILCLWIGCATLAVCCSYHAGVSYALHIAGPDLDLSIQEGFSLLLPTLLAFTIGAAAAIAAIVGLCLSRWSNKQPLVSWPHLPMLLLLWPCSIGIAVYNHIYASL